MKISFKISKFHVSDISQTRVNKMRRGRMKHSIKINSHCCDNHFTSASNKRAMRFVLIKLHPAQKQGLIVFNILLFVAIIVRVEHARAIINGVAIAHTQCPIN